MDNNDAIVAIGSSDGSVVLREISTGNEIRTLELGHPVEDIILTSDKVIAISEQNIKVWNIDQTDPWVDDSGELFALNDNFLN